MARITATQHKPHQAGGSVTIEGTEDEIRAIEGMLLGTCYVRQDTEKNRLCRHDAYLPLPDPVDDPAIPSDWQILGPGHSPDFKVVEIPDPSGNIYSPAIYVSHLCGYGWSLEGYRGNARRLRGYGFECMRSRRGSDGRFWEVWYLPGFWSAKGGLKAHIESTRKQSPSDASLAKSVVEFLCQNVQFGSCNVSVQRAAMVID